MCVRVCVCVRERVYLRSSRLFASLSLCLGASVPLCLSVSLSLCCCALRWSLCVLSHSQNPTTIMT